MDMGILQKYQEALALHWVNLADDLAQPRLRKHNRDCHHLKASRRVNKDMAVTWAKCMVREAPSTVQVQEAWVAIINMVDRVIREVATALMAPDMVRALMAAAIVEDGVPIMGTDISLKTGMSHLTSNR